MYFERGRPIVTVLSDAKVRAAIAVSDHDRAKTFYRDTLGLNLVDERPGIATFEGGGGTLLDVYVSEFAGSTRSTAAGFDVADLDEAMTQLRGRGITFEDYDQGALKTSDGVAAIGGIRGAWFKDPDGNILAVVQVGVE